MANKTVVLVDNGHGKETPGKRSPDGSFREYRWAREVACMVCDLLQAQGYDARLLSRRNGTCRWRSAAGGRTVTTSGALSLSASITTPPATGPRSAREF